MKKVLGLVLTLALALPLGAQASSFVLAPGSVASSVGRTFTINIKVSAIDQAINAVSGLISFPAGQLQVVSVSKSGSLVNIWVKEPSFSNSAGTISFEGAILNPGYQGGSGQILSVVFRGANVGQALVAFRNASILANDGLGTNVTVGLASGQYDINAALPTPAPTPGTTPKPTGPALGEITSATHVSPDTWSNSHDAQFSWQLPDDVTAVQYGLDQNIVGKPGAATVGRISSVTVPLGDFVNDGTYYFHLRFATATGWGVVQTRRILVDRVPPESLEISEVQSGDTTNPRRELHVDTSDTSSGVDHLQVSWDGGELRVPGSSAGRFILPLLPPGTHDVSIRSVDKAGNGRVGHAIVRVDPIPSPTLTVDKVPPGTWGFLKADKYEPVVYGTAEDSEDVLVHFARSNGEQQEVVARTQADGSWRLAFAPLAQGNWKVTAVARDERGALSLPAGPLQIASETPWGTFLSVLPWALVLLLGAIIWFLVRRRRTNVTDVPIIIEQ